MRRTFWLVAPFALSSCASPPPPARPSAPPPLPAPLVEAAKPSLTGVWLGTLHTGGKDLRLRLRLDLEKAPAGCAIESLDQGAMKIACDQVIASPSALSLAAPAIGGSLTGPVAADGNTVYGTWTQAGAEMALVLTREGGAPGSPALASAPGVQTAKPSMSGVWLGTLHPGGNGRLRIQIQLDLSQTPPSCSFESLDQAVPVVPCSNVTASPASLALDVASIGGNLTGPISGDGNTVYASWTQGRIALSLVMTRQAAAIQSAKLDPAIPPVSVEQIQSVMDKDLAPALATGALAPATGQGVTIGVVVHGVRRIFTYGPVKPDSVYELGSITKTFTGLILAQMVEQKKVRLDEAVRALLPPGTVAAPASGAEITLVDLSAQRSGLPRMPENLDLANTTDPYAGYDTKALYAFIASHGVGMPPKPQFEYSNLGVGLLGTALAERAGTNYETLLRKEVTEPLGMRDTVVTLTPPMRDRLAPGHDAAHAPAKPWNFNALVGCGGIRSTAADMLTYLEAQLHPDRLPASARRGGEGKTLPAALTASHAVQGEAWPRQHIALNWFRTDETGSYWHDGATGGYSAFSLFNPEKDLAVIVLSDTSIGAEGNFADDLGTHVVQRLMGKPAVALGPKGE